MPFVDDEKNSNDNAYEVDSPVEEQPSRNYFKFTSRKLLS